MRLSRDLGRAAWLIRYRYAVLATVSVVVALRTVWFTPSGGDFSFFQLAALVFTGRPEEVPVNLFFTGPSASTGPLELYRDVPVVQIGPVPLLLCAPFVLLLPHQVAVASLATICALGLPLCLWLLERAADDHLGRDDARPFLVLVAGAACLMLWPVAFSQYLHPDDVLLLVSACAAVRVGVQGRWVSAAVLLGIAAGAKPWGAALLPVAVLGARSGHRLVALTLSGVVALLPWLPFVLGSAGTVAALGSFHIFVSDVSPLALVWSGDQIPAWLRPVQVGVGGVLALAAVAARRPLWALPLAIGFRLCVEGQVYPYYFAVLAVAAVAADLGVRGRGFPWTTTAVVFLVYDARWLVSQDWQVAVIQAGLLPVIVLTAMVPKFGRRASSGRALLVHP